MINRFKTITLMVVTTLATALGLAVATPAHAAFTDCRSGWFCAWTGYQATGTRCEWPGESIQSLGGYITRPKGCGNNTKSWYNRTAYAIEIIDPDNCDPGTIYWHRQVVIGQRASGEGSDWNNRMSSINLSYPISAACDGGQA